MSRKIDSCRFCKDVGEIAGDGLCYRCYRRLQRATKRKSGSGADVRAEDKRLLRLYPATIINLMESGLTQEEILSVKKDHLDNCFSSVAVYLTMSSEEESE